MQVAEDFKSQEMRHRQEFALTISFVSRNAFFFAQGSIKSIQFQITIPDRKLDAFLKRALQSCND